MLRQTNAHTYIIIMSIKRDCRVARLRCVALLIKLSLAKITQQNGREKGDESH